MWVAGLDRKKVNFPTRRLKVNVDVGVVIFHLDFLYAFSPASYLHLVSIQIKWNGFICIIWKFMVNFDQYTDEPDEWKVHQWLSKTNKKEIIVNDEDHF